MRHPVSTGRLRAEGLTFHAGEIAVQQRAGVREQVEAFGGRMIRAAMPQQHRDFFAKLPTLLVGSIDREGRPWASMLAGRPGFVHSPDEHRLRIEASDAPSNPSGQARTASQVSDPFLVDNTPPSVQVTVRRTCKDLTVEASATDTPGPIARAEYSLDAGRFVTVAPIDGVSDSRSEAYSIPLPSLRAGEHTVIVKVTDLLGNTGAGKTTFNSD